jgi:FkbM family methyltransferase
MSIIEPLAQQEGDEAAAATRGSGDEVSGVESAPRWLRRLRAVTSAWPYRGAPALFSWAIGAIVRPPKGSWAAAPALGLCPPLEFDLGAHWHRELYFFPRTYGAFYLRRPFAAYLDANLRAGAVFLDVGANVGIFTQHAARLVGSDGLVVAFEPEPTTHEALARSVRRAGHRNVRCVRAAASDHVGVASFHRAADGTASSLVAERAGSDRYVADLDVEVTTVDAQVAAMGVDPARIALVKVDVEGEEARAVAGMRETLRAARPPIWCEVRGPRGSTRAPGTFADVAAVLAPLGYAPFRWNGRPEPVAVADVRGREDILFVAS